MPQRVDDTPPSDEELARRAQHRCTASFEELVRRYQVPLMHFLQQRLSREDAEDLVQEAFVRAHENLGQYRPRWRFATWLFTIARRLSLDHQQRIHRRAGVEMLSWRVAAVPEPSSTVAVDESRRHLWELARQVLNERQFTALWLYYVEGMPVSGVAEVLKCTPAAVKMILYRARQRLVAPLMKQRNDGSAVKVLASPPRPSLLGTGAYPP